MEFHLYGFHSAECRRADLSDSWLYLKMMSASDNENAPKPECHYGLSVGKVIHNYIWLIYTYLHS